MARIELTLSTDYCLSWGVWEGVREIIQNGLDAHDAGHHLTVAMVGDLLTVENEGTAIDSSIWLMGATSKREGVNRGHFGEGAKLAALALLRQGRSMVVASGHHVWTPSLGPSEVFPGQTTLALEGSHLECDIGKVVVTVSPVSMSEWEQIQNGFLALMPPERSFGLETKSRKAKLLTHPDQKGRIFVKGIFVCHCATAAYGYDFDFMATDRDRRLISGVDLRLGFAQVLRGLFHERKIDGDFLMDLLQKETEDVASLRLVNDFSGELTGAVANAFRARHGENAYPVVSLADTHEAEHLGKMAVVVSPTLHRILKMTSMFESPQASVNTNITRHINHHTELSGEQRRIYDIIVDAVNEALDREKIERKPVRFVEFADPTIFGIYLPSMLAINWKLRDDPLELLATVVHEACHAVGLDGSVQHERAIERVLSQIAVKHLLKDPGS